MNPDNNPYQDKSPLNSTPRFRCSDNSDYYDINFLNLNNDSIKYINSQDDPHKNFKEDNKNNESRVSNIEFQVDENFSLCSIKNKEPNIIVKNDYNPIIDNIINNYSFANDNIEIFHKDKNLLNSFQTKEYNQDKNTPKININSQTKITYNNKKNKNENNNKKETIKNEDNFRYNLPLENDKISDTIDFFQFSENKNVLNEKNPLKNKKSLDISNISRNIIKIEKYNYTKYYINNKNKSFMKNANNTVYNHKKEKIDTKNQTCKNLTEGKNEKPLTKKIINYNYPNKMNKINSNENENKTYLTSKNRRYKNKIKYNTNEQNNISNNLYYKTQEISTPVKKNFNNLELEISNSNKKNYNNKYNDSLNRTNTIELNSRYILENNNSKKNLKDIFISKRDTPSRVDKSTHSHILLNSINSENKKIPTSDNYNYFYSDKNNFYFNPNKKESKTKKNAANEKKNNVNSKVIKGLPIKKWEFLKDFNTFDSNDNINSSNCITDLNNNISYTDREIIINRNNSKKYLINEKNSIHMKGKTNKVYTIRKHLNNDNNQTFFKQTGCKKNINNSLNNTNNNKSHIYCKSNYIPSTIPANNKKNNIYSNAPIKPSNVITETLIKTPSTLKTQKKFELINNLTENNIISNDDSKLKIVIKRKNKVTNMKKTVNKTEQITRSNTEKYLSIPYEFNINDAENGNVTDRIKYKDTINDLQKIKVNKLQNKNNLVINTNNNPIYNNSEVLNPFSATQNYFSNTSSNINFYWKKNKNLKNLCLITNESIDKHDKPKFYGKHTIYNEFTGNKLHAFSKPNFIHSQDDICGNSSNNDSKETNSNLKTKTYVNNKKTRNIINIDPYYCKNQTSPYENESLILHSNISNSASLLYQKPKRIKKIKDGNKSSTIIKSKINKMNADINNDDIIKYSILRNNIMNQVSQAFSLTLGDEKSSSKNNGRNENFTIKNSIVDNNDSTRQSNEDYKKQ